MNLNDFIKVLKLSILIDLGVYLMALIKNGANFHNVDILNILSSFPLVFIFCVFILQIRIQNLFGKIPLQSIQKVNRLINHRLA